MRTTGLDALAGGADARSLGGWVPEQEFLWWWAADRFGWTPEQAERVPARRMAWIRYIDTRMRRHRRAST